MLRRHRNADNPVPIIVLIGPPLWLNLGTLTHDQPSCREKYIKLVAGPHSCSQSRCDTRNLALYEPQESLVAGPRNQLRQAWEGCIQLGPHKGKSAQGRFGVWAKSVRTVSLMTANQEFSKLINEAEQSQRFLISRRGRPIAKLAPHTADKTADPEWAVAYRRMMARLEEGASLGGLKVERDEFYER